MALSDVFRDLFRDTMAERELATLSHHIAVPTFNLSTTSLRHINKWYDRLEEIAKAAIRATPTFTATQKAWG